MTTAQHVDPEEESRAFVQRRKALRKSPSHEPELNLESILAPDGNTPRNLGTPRRQIIPKHIKMQVKTWLQQNDNTFPSAREFKDLLSLTGLKHSQLYSLLRRMREVKGILTPHNRKFIREFVGNYPDDHTVTKEHYLDLCAKTGLSESQVRHQIVLQRDKARISLSPEIKSYLREWVLSHRRLPNTSERRQIMNHTKLSSSQLRSQLSLMLDVGEKITEKKRSYIRSWLAKQNKDQQQQAADAQESNHPRTICTPTPEEITFLCESTSLSRRQVHYLVSVLQEQPTPVTHQKKLMISSYIDELGRYPLRQERRELETRTGLSASQIQHILKHMKYSSGDVTEQSKEILIKWLRDNDNRLPSEEERAELLDQTGWSRSQLYTQLRYMSDKRGEITPECKEAIREWLAGMEWRSPTVEERRAMREQLGLSRTQLNAQISWMRSVHTKENARHVRN